MRAKCDHLMTKDLLTDNNFFKKTSLEWEAGCNIWSNPKTIFVKRNPVVFNLF